MKNEVFDKNFFLWSTLTFSWVNIPNQEEGFFTILRKIQTKRLIWGHE